jgi:hypothetical protein
VCESVIWCLRVCVLRCVSLFVGDRGTGPPCWRAMLTLWHPCVGRAMYCNSHNTQDTTHHTTHRTQATNTHNTHNIHNKHNTTHNTTTNTHNRTHAHLRKQPHSIVLSPRLTPHTAQQTTAMQSHLEKAAAGRRTQHESGVERVAWRHKVIGEEREATAAREKPLGARTVRQQGIAMHTMTPQRLLCRRRSSGEAAGYRILHGVTTTRKQSVSQIHHNDANDHTVYAR